jgi:multidrug resistance protein, MATE family
MSLREHIRESLKLAIPVMLTNIGHVMMGVCDNVMVGHLNAQSLAAAGLATVVFNVFLLFGIGVSYAITPLVAEAFGANDRSTISETLRHGLVINSVNGLVLIFVVSIGQNLLYHIDQPKEVVELAIPFLNIIMYSLVPVLIYQSFKQFAEGLSNTKVAMVVIWMCNVINVLLNYLLIYGHWGLPALGLNGAGWATFICRVIMAASIAGYIYYSPKFREYRDAFSFGQYSKKLLGKILNLGIPSGVQFIFEVAAFDFSLVMMGWLGTKTQAAHQIAINLATLSYLTTAGLAAAATVRVGYFLGKKDVINLRTATYSLLSIALIVMSLCAFIFIIGRAWLPSLYISDPEVISITASLLIVAGIFQLSDGTQVVCASALRGMQDVKLPSSFIFVAYWLVGLPLGYWLGIKAGYGATGIWLGLLIGLTLTAVAMFIRLRWRIRKIAASV